MPQETGTVKISSFRISRYTVYRIMAIVGCTAFNVGLYALVHKLGLPFYLDTVGTILISMLGGTFTGIMTAVATNLFCEFVRADSVYYAFVGISIALATSWFTKNEKFKKKTNILMLILLLAVLGGGLGTILQWLLLGEPEFSGIAETAKALSGSSSWLYFLFSMFIVVFINIIDKSICVAIALGLFFVIPAEARRKIRTTGWKQAPLSFDDLRSIGKNRRNGVISLKSRIVLMLVVAVSAIVLLLSWVSVSVQMNEENDNYLEMAAAACRFAASVVDADKIEDYIREGGSVADRLKTDFEYKADNDILSEYAAANHAIQAIYVFKARKDGFYPVYDTETAFLADGIIGEKKEYGGYYEFIMDDLIAGRKLEPDIIKNEYGRFFSAYEPIYDSDGRLVAYAGADIWLERGSDYLRKLFINMLLVSSGFMALIIAYGLRSARAFLIYPIGSLERRIEDFMQNMDDQSKLDENVRKLQKLDIRTNDEVEALYRSVCEMAAGTADHIKNINALVKKNENMENGLILTMADMVESRDQDAASHAMRTAAYVRIILDGLKRKGYYAEKLTDKYIKDVEMSAPLHDVGKINIPDTILNKTGKLTDEEYEIMKTHTLAGKTILENAINAVHSESYLKEARNMAAYHHERWDGTGYPEGLHGQVIPLSARVMAVADAFDAITSDKTYKQASTLNEALKTLSDGAGTQFDPKCVEVFVDSVAEVRTVMKKYRRS